MRNENHEVGNYKDQLKQLEIELDMSESNKEMFYRLWLKWEKEHMDIQRAILRVKNQIEEIKRHPQ